MHYVKKAGLAFALVVILGLLAFIWIPPAMGALIALRDVPGRINWRAKTTPLRAEVVEDLCSQLGLDASDRRCEAGAVVYAPEFFNDLRRVFSIDSTSGSTYEDVEERLGRYRFKLEPMTTQADGLTYFVARYDFRGDRIFPVGMFFYADGRLFRIIADVGD